MIVFKQIILIDLKLFNHVQIIDTRYEYLISYNCVPKRTT